ncbi:hypothetical protein R5W24_006298 [Gemmata sp. JC717]|uniref:hypothetical protein n=1 Tax=Gemmata algarum TaxID=2975278 RepID=UPI0021BB8284|nr:hypothetical protein [Gemmata algarum]MDY3557111.1 hypothetical protein [Gemmata algarum]
MFGEVLIQMGAHYDVQAQQVEAAIALGPRLVVIGSTSFWGHDSHPLCEAIATEMAEFAALVVITGGMDGVGRTFGRAFAAARREAGRPENLFHLLPRGTGPCDSGVTLGAGADYRDRRELLGRVGHVYLVVEGGPGTAHEATVAAGRRVPVLPLGRTGGHAADLHIRTTCPPGLSKVDWDLMADEGIPHGRVVAAVGRLVRQAVVGSAKLGAVPDTAG